MEIYLSQLVLEITRKCNMSCKHCLRGEAQDVDMPLDVIDKTLDAVNGISTITFSGGEPTLNIPAMKYALKVCKEKNIPVYSFFVATNGKEVTTDFLTCMIDWYAYCYDCGGEIEISAVALSQDMFHDCIDQSNISRLQALSFFDENAKKTDWDKMYLINEGRAAELPSSAYKKRELDPRLYSYYIEGYQTLTVVSYLYFSADGTVKISCDTAYENDAFSIGNVKDEALVDIMYRCHCKTNEYEEAI